MAVAYIFRAVFLAVLIVFTQQKCEPPTSSSGPFIPILPKTYMAKAEVTEGTKNKTSYVVEYFDNGKGAIYVHSEGEEIIFLYDDKTLLKITTVSNDNFQDSTVCKGQNITYNSDGFIIGTEQPGGDISYFMLGGGLLHYQPYVRFKYLDSYQIPVRGILADSWTACFILPKIDGNFEVTYHWSALNSKDITPSGDRAVPIKTEIVGSYQPNPNANETVHVDTVSHIVWFQSNFNIPDEIFQPPHGVFCENNGKSKRFPVFPNTFTTRVEMILEMEGQPINFLESTQYWYDIPAKLVRSDAGGNVEIRDYSRKNRYVINNGKCSLSQLQGSFREYRDVFLPENLEYQYHGKYNVRGRNSDVWVAKNGSEITEWSFLDESWDNKYSVPVQMVRTRHEKDSTERETLNFFLFQSDPVQFSFDLSDCMLEMKHEFFQLYFPTGIRQIELTVFAANARPVLATLAKVSPLRFLYLDADYKNKLLVLQFALLDLLPNQIPLLNDVSLLEAKNNLENAVNNNEVVISSGEPTSEVDYLTALPFSFQNLEVTSNCHPSNSARVRRSVDADKEKESRIDHYTPGQLTGFGIGLFIFGLLIGAVATLIYLIRQKGQRSDQVQLRVR